MNSSEKDKLDTVQTDSTVSNAFLERLARLREQVGDRPLVKKDDSNTDNQLDFNTATPIAPVAEQYLEDVPDVDLTQRELPKAEQTLDEFFRTLPITDAYRRWGGQGKIAHTTRDEIKTLCPNPAHKDTDPSFSMNQRTGKFNCFKCGGGDVFVLAGWYYGFPTPIPRHQFRQLRDQMAADFGIYTAKSVTGETILSKTPEPTAQSEQPEPAQPEPAQPEQTATVSYLPEGSARAQKESYENRQHDRIDWRNLVPEGTFLHEYLKVTTVDDCPEEYHFWGGLLALGLAVGRNRTLQDSPPVYGNLFVCFTGPTGTGKSKAKGHLTTLLRDHLPYKPEDQPPLGARLVKNPQSGEVLVSRFMHPALDPADPKKVLGYFPVRMLAEYEELAGLIGRAGRQGNTLKDVLMDMYDARKSLSSDSLANSLYSENCFGSALTTTQYKSVRELISRYDDVSGFANRWVYATGPEKPQFSRNKLVLDFTRPGGLLRIIAGEALSHSEITWSEEADTLWDQFFQQTVMPYKKSSEDNSIGQRMDLLFKKLFLLFTINNREKVLTADTVSRVIQLFSYLRESYELISEQISASHKTDTVDNLVAHIMRLTTSKRGPTANELYRAMQRKYKDISAIRKALSDLVELGLIAEHLIPPGPRGGRPSKCYTPPSFIPEADTHPNAQKQEKANASG